MGTVFTRRFEADRIGSQVPVKLMHLEGLYELFVSKFVSLCGSLLVMSISTVISHQSGPENLPSISHTMMKSWFPI